MLHDVFGFAQEERAPRPQSRPGSGASNQEQHPHILSLRAERDQRLAVAAAKEAAAKEAANARPGSSSNSSRSVLKPAFTAELCDFVECCLRRDPKARLTAEELLAHPFLVRHRNKAAASLSSSSARPHQQTRTPHEDTGKEEEGDDEAAAHEGSELFDGWGSTSSLFRPLETSDACAARLFSAIVRHLNAANSHEKNRQHNRDEEDAAGPTAALPLIGLRDDQLASLCAQLPSLTLERAKAMHDQALQVLRDEDARLVAMAAARVRAAAQAQEASLKAAAASAAGDPPSRHHRRGQSGSDRTRRRDSRK
jgi:serine/threonine protein kinase